MGEDRLTHRAGPHPQGSGELSCLGVTCQMLPEGALVDVVFAADGAWVVGSPSFRYIRASANVSERHCRHEHICKQHTC